MNEDEIIATIKCVVDAGVNRFDSAGFYGTRGAEGVALIDRTLQ